MFTHKGGKTQFYRVPQSIEKDEKEVIDLFPVFYCNLSVSR